MLSAVEQSSLKYPEIDGLLCFGLNTGLLLLMSCFIIILLLFTMSLHIYMFHSMHILKILITHNI